MEEWTEDWERGNDTRGHQRLFPSLATDSAQLLSQAIYTSSLVPYSSVPWPDWIFGLETH